MPADDYQVALALFETRDSWKSPPALESCLLEQSEARVVVPENVADERTRVQPRRVSDRLLEQPPGNSPPAEFFIHVNADLRRAAVSGAADELVKTEPARDLGIDLGNPERERVRRMPAEPRQAFLHRDRLEQRR